MGQGEGPGLHPNPPIVVGCSLMISEFMWKYIVILK